MFKNVLHWPWGLKVSLAADTLWALYAASTDSTPTDRVSQLGALSRFIRAADRLWEIVIAASGISVDGQPVRMRVLPMMTSSHTVVALDKRRCAEVRQAAARRRKLLTATTASWARVLQRETREWRNEELELKRASQNPTNLFLQRIGEAQCGPAYLTNCLDCEKTPWGTRMIREDYSRS